MAVRRASDGGQGDSTHVHVRHVRLDRTGTLRSQASRNDGVIGKSFAFEGLSCDFHGADSNVECRAAYREIKGVDSIDLWLSI